jgi:hypothetical protein
MAEIEAAQAQLREIVRDLEAVKLRLVGVKESLPELDAGPEAVAADLETLDVRTEIRSVIECVLNDWMAPAIADLREMAALPASPSERKDS